jgi:hypothetical protein
MSTRYRKPSRHTARRNTSSGFVSRLAWCSIRRRVASDDAAGRDRAPGLSRDRQFSCRQGDVLGDIVKESVHEPQSALLCSP